MYMLSLYPKLCLYVGPRMMHHLLLRSHNELVVIFSNNNKRSCIDDQGHILLPSNMLPLQALIAANKGATFFTYS